MGLRGRSGWVRKILPQLGSNPRINNNESNINLDRDLKIVTFCLYIITVIVINFRSVRCYSNYINVVPIPVAARSKAWVCGLSLAGIAGSNPAGDMDVCIL